MRLRDLLLRQGSKRNRKRVSYRTSRLSWRNALRLRFELLEPRTLLSDGSGNPLLPLEPAAAEADYLIIAAHNLYNPADVNDPMAQLARWKQKKGFLTYVLRLPAWQDYNYTGAQMVEYIDEYIAQAYNTGHQTSYVLLVGDYNWQTDSSGEPVLPTGAEQDYCVPSDMFLDPWYGAQEVYCPTDLPYSCVVGDDILPDLTLGRLPVDNRQKILSGGVSVYASKPNETTNVIDKILRYDANPDELEVGWYDDVLIAAEFDNGIVGSNIATQYNMENAMYVYDKLSLNDRGMDNTYTALCPESMPQSPHDTEYHKTSEQYPHRITLPKDASGLPTYDVPDGVVDKWQTKSEAKTAVINALNDGVGIALHRGHGHNGSDNGWSLPEFRTPDVVSLTNGVKTPVVFSIECYAGPFHDDEYNFEDAVPDGSLAEVLLWEPNGGAVGVVASTAVSYIGYNDLLTLGIFKSFWEDFEESDPEEYTNVYTLSMRPAEALNYGKYYMAHHEGYPAPDYRSEAEFKEFHWFGDPEMMLGEGVRL